MKIVINKEIIQRPNGIYKPASVYIAADGRITLSGKAVVLMGLKPTDAVCFEYDTDIPGEISIYKHADGLKLRKKMSNGIEGKMLVSYSRKATIQIAAFFKTKRPLYLFFDKKFTTDGSLKKFSLYIKK